MTKTLQDFACYQNTDVPLSFLATDEETGLPLNLTGTTLKWRLSREPGLSTILDKTCTLSGTPDDGTFSLTLTKAETAVLLNTYYYDVRLTDGTGAETIIATGSVLVLPSNPVVVPAKQLTQGIFNYLASDPGIASRLATYSFDGVLRPAVFTDLPVPEDATFPFITVSGNITGTALDTTNTMGAETTRDFGAYDKASAGQAVLDDLADYLRSLLHFRPFSVPLYRMISCSAGYPVIAPTDQTANGRLITVRFLLGRLEATE